ncbi:MAG: protein kinase [Myxococcales bacterium]|nr:protein kinase [Polyangiaceae bacterium]MDW8251051.1 protein kinase [Myxococcales bacterium]
MEHKMHEVNPFEQTALGPEGSGPLENLQAPSRVPQSKSTSGSPLSSSAELSFLRPFGPFTRVEPLSEQGAMGLVARGYNAAFDRWELLKFLRSEHAQNVEIFRQFQREGRILAKLSHPNVVQVFAIYALDGHPCLAMEFLEGESLQAYGVRHAWRLPLARWYELLLAAARGLSAAHEVGLLHRDLKPENLFVLEERRGGVGGLKLIDFGLATADRSRKDVSHDALLVAGLSGGTPLFMAPELWKQQEASPRTDLFALGMTFFVAATGKLPYTPGNTIPEVMRAVCDEQPFPDIRTLRPDMPAPLAGVLRRLLAKRPEERYESAVELVTALVAASAEARVRRVPGSGPYRGLSSFSASERDVFFGRETEVVEALERLRAQGGLVLVGPSGSGKSSLAHAGIVPAIEEGALGGGILFRSTCFEPRSRPLTSLAAALSRALSSPEDEVLATLRATPEGLGPLLRKALPPGAGLLLVVDQLEEIATLAVDAGEVNAFVRALGSLTEVSVPELRLLATLRVDLMDRLFSQEPLRPLLTRGFYPVRPLLGDGLRRALTGPAQAAGYSFEDPALINSILDDVARSSAGLPLLSFAMAAWWQARDEERKILPSAAWNALGGLAGALARHGDSVLAGMGHEERSAAEQILLRLVSAENTRARAPRSTLLDPAAVGTGAERALDRLLQSKLLHEANGEIELAHESLISHWPALRELLQTSGEDRAFRERVALASREWDSQGRPAGALWSKEQAVRLLRWFGKTPSALDQTELAFIEAVRSHQLRRKFLLRIGGVAMVVAVCTLVLATKRSERELRMQLTEATRKASQLELDYRKAEGARLRSLAERQLTENPSRALATAFESYEKSPDPVLDILAWRARYRGLSYPLPLHQRGARFAVFSGKSDWLATGGGDGAVFFQSVSGPETVLVKPSREAQAVPRSVAFSDDTLAVGFSSGELMLARGPQFSPRVLTECEGSVEQVGWMGGRLLIRCGGSTGKLLQYEMETQRCHELAHGDLVGMAVTQDGSLGVGAYRSGKLTLVNRKGEVSEAEAPPGALALVALAPSGERLVVAAQDGTIRWASVKAGRPEAFQTLSEGIHGPPLALGVGPEGVIFAVSSSHQARLWLGGRSVIFEKAAPVFTWSARHFLLLLANTDDDVLLISLHNGEVVGRLQGSTGPITGIHTTRLGTWAVVSSEDGATRGYRLEDCSTLVTRGPLPSPPATCAVSPDGAAVACADAQALTVTPVYGSAGGLKEARSLPLNEAPRLVAVGPRGEHLAWAVANRWTLDDRALPGLSSPSVLQLSEHYVALGGTDEGGHGKLLLAPLQDGTPRWIQPDAPLAALTFSREGNRLAALTTTGHALILDPASGAMSQSFSLESARLEGEPTALSLSDEGDLLAVGSAGGVVATLGLAGKAPRRVMKFSARIDCLAWAQAGRALAVATADQRRYALDTETGQWFPTGHGSPTVACARSPIDDRFTHVFRDGSIYLRLIDTSPLTMSQPPEPTLDPRTMPLTKWPGFPAVWR